jgi:AcrR family transcriptional regulator
VPKIVDAEDRRAALATAAARLIADHGIENVRLKDIAAEAGWTTGALTHYFPNKRAVLKLAMTTALDQLQGLKEDVVADQGDELRWLLEQALPLDEDRLRHWRVSQAFMVQSWGDAELTEIRVRAFRRWRRRLVTLFGAAQDAGRFRGDLDPEQAVDFTIALVDGVALQVLYDSERWSPERQLAFLDAHLAQMAP